MLRHPRVQEEVASKMTSEAREAAAAEAAARRKAELAADAARQRADDEAAARRVLENELAALRAQVDPNTNRTLPIRIAARRCLATRHVSQHVVHS